MINSSTNFKELNRTRVKLKMTDLINQVKPTTKETLLQSTIYKDGHKVTIKDIDFSKPFVIISQFDVLGLIGVLGLQRLNKVSIKDTTSNGSKSTINTDYMIVDSQEARYARAPLEYSYIADTEQYQSISYMTKDLILWRLVSDSGAGDNNVMYRIVTSLIEERIMLNKLNWIFYIGTLESFNKQYGIQGVPIYIIEKPSNSRRSDIFW